MTLATCNKSVSKTRQKESGRAPIRRWFVPTEMAMGKLDLKLRQAPRPSR